MPCTLRRIPIAGSANDDFPVGYEADSLAEAARYEPDDGVYGVFATWHGHRVVCLSRHLDRLEDSARRAGFSLTLDRELLRAQLRRLLRESGYAEARIRISAAPGRETLTVGMEPYKGPPVELQREGVACSTIAHAARDKPEAKQTGWLLERSAFAAADPYAAYEQLLVDPGGQILEGVSSNFAAIVTEKNAQARLQTAADGILPGIARSIMLDVAPSTIEVDLRPPHLERMSDFAEAFITSASRGIIPVISIDGVPVGTGTPGRVTAELIRRYRQRAAELEEAL